jgi:hypothetical protein
MWSGRTRSSGGARESGHKEAETVAQFFPNLRRLTASRIVCPWRRQVPGLQGVYDQGTHRAKKRAALEKWGTSLLSIVEENARLPVAKLGVGFYALDVET